MSNCFKSSLRCCFVTTPIFLWIGVRLLGYVICLAPMFARFAWYYFVASHRTTVKYGTASRRQTLDVYAPVNIFCRRRDSLVDQGHLGQDEHALPTIFFCCGGAWIIGYKMWGCLLARFLCSFGYTCILPDYRNYPFGNIPDMIDDVRAALEYTTNNFDDVVAVGQSAGGHLLMVEILQSVLAEKCRLSNKITGLVCVSGPLDLATIQRTFTRNGLDDQFINRLFDNRVDEYNPILLLDHFDEAIHKDRLPPIRIYHGDADATVSWEGSQRFADKLATLHADTKFHIYEHWSHTDPILEGPADGDHRFHLELIGLLNEWTKNEQVTEIPDDHASLKRLCPHWMVQIARFCMPF